MVTAVASVVVYINECWSYVEVSMCEIYLPAFCILVCT